jgi:hypothetical protein
VLQGKILSLKDEKMGLNRHSSHFFAWMINHNQPICNLSIFLDSQTLVFAYKFILRLALAFIPIAKPLGVLREREREREMMRSEKE